MSLRAVLFDVDFTLARPGPELGPEGYVRAGARHGLLLVPERYADARDAALGSRPMAWQTPMEADRGARHVQLQVRF